MINKYLIAKNPNQIGYNKEENNYYYEPITDNMQLYSVTWRGNSNQLVNNNRLIHLLFDNGIRYKAVSFLSKNADDCLLPCYFIRVTFWTNRNYIHDKANHKQVSWKELTDKILAVKNVNGSYI